MHGAKTTVPAAGVRFVGPGDHRFTWVLPGHGARVHAHPDELHRRLVALVERMRTGTCSR